MKELITKNLEVKDKLNYELHKKVDSYESTFLSRPMSLRFWSSFFVILPIFILNLFMTQSVLNTFKILNICIKVGAFNLLKYDIRSFLKHDLNLLK